VKPEHVLFNSEKVAKLSGFFLAQVGAKTEFDHTDNAVCSARVMC
jgi:hypothetical protein